MPSVSNAQNSFPVSSSNDEMRPASAQGPKELSPEDFIKIFLAQLKNQNPLQPTDSSSILQQMSAISSIKSSDKLQQTLGNLQNNINLSLGNTQLISATQLIGKKVQIAQHYSALEQTGETLSLKGSVHVPDKCTNVVVSIKNSAGEVVKRMELGPAGSSGLVDFNWDGMGGEDGKKKFDPDVYQISAVATINGEEKSVPTSGSFKVNSVAVNKENGSVIFNLDKWGGVEMKDIVKML